MNYHVGRTCAVAGYVGLYRELDLLPDVSITEKACKAGYISQDIFEDITQQLVRYSVINDYTLKVDLERPREGAFINCDAAMKSMLEVRQDVRHQFQPDEHTMRLLRSNFDVTKDDGIDNHDTATQHNPPLAEHEVPLLCLPLPLDLPSMNKDVLILMTAYEGNVDRGIYHNTTFAKWWSLEIKSCTTTKFYLKNIGAAVNARFIINNDLSLVLDLPQPYLIWYPLWPQRETLDELVDMVPSMRLQVAHACIVADYRMLHNPYYKADLELRSAGLGFDISSLSEKYKVVINADINRFCTNRDKEPTDRFLWRELPALDMTNDQCAGIYDGGLQANAKDYNLFICTSAAMRAKLPKDGDGWTLYVDYE